MRRLHVGTPGCWSHEESMEVNFHQFSQLDHEVDAYTLSPEFLCHGLKWFLKLYPGGEKGVDDKAKGTTKADEVMSSMCLFNTDTSVKDKECKAKFSLRFPNIDVAIGLPLYERVFNNTTGWGEAEPRQKILDKCIDDTFTVIVKIQVYVPKQQAWTPTQSLQKDVLRFMQEESFADVVFLVGADTAQQRIQVNSAILAIRAPVIKEMVGIANKGTKQTTHDVDDVDSEQELPIIPLPSVNPNYFRLLIAYIYSDDTIFLNDKQLDLKQLLILTNRFGCWQLKLCIEAKLIEDTLNLDTSIDLLMFADAQSCFMLKESALAVVAQSSFATHRDFMQLANAPHLLEEVHLTAVRKPSKQDRKDKYSGMSIPELYQELEKQGINLKSDGDRFMLLQKLRPSKKRKL